MIYYLIYILVACYTKLSVHVYEGEESFYLQRRLIYVHCWLMDQLAVTIFKYYIIFLFIFLFFIVYFLFLNKNWNIIYNSYL